MLGILSLYVVKFKSQLFLHGASVSDWSDKVSNPIFLAQAYSFHECKEMGHLSLAEIKQGVIGQQM